MGRNIKETLKYFVPLFIVLICAIVVVYRNNIKWRDEELLEEISEINNWYKYKVVEHTEVPDYITLFRERENEFNNLKREYELGDTTKMDSCFNEMGKVLKDMDNIITHMNLNQNSVVDVPIKTRISKTVKSLILDVIYFDGSEKTKHKEVVMRYGDNGTNLYLITDLIGEYSDIYQSLYGYYQNIESSCCE